MFLYTFCIISYHFIVKLISPFNKKAAFFTNGRTGILQIISAKVKNDSSAKIWIHCASLGEFEQGRPIIEKLKQQYPTKKIILTFFSPSGYELRKDYDKADYVFYLPADTKKNAKKFLDILKPELAIFVKYEFWLNYLNTLHEKNVPIVLVSGIFRRNQHFFKWYGGIFKRTLFHYHHLFLQTEESKKILNDIGIKNCSVAGDTRFDRVFDISKNPKKFDDIKNFTQNKFTIIAGSSWLEDEKHLIQSFLKLKHKHPNLNLIIAPHNIEKSDINHLITAITNADKNLTWQKYSEGILNEKADILIIDSIGILSSLYQYGDIAYIGGGFGNGIHNILEALVYGIPAVFGPNYKKFNEATDAIKLGIGKSFSNQNELDSVLTNLVENDEERSKIRSQCDQYVQNNIGSSDKVLNYIRNIHVTYC